MKNIGIVFSFELKAILRKKSYIITTIILCLIVLSLIILPGFWANNNDTSIGDLDLNDPDLIVENGISSTDLEENLEKGGYVLQTDSLAGFQTLEIFEQKFDSEDGLKLALENDQIAYGVVFQDINKFTFLVNGNQNDLASQLIYQSLIKYNRELYFESHGLNPELIDEIYELSVNVDNVDISQQATGNFIFSMAYTFLMYMMIIMYGSTVSTSVAREKDNRTMEVLIANTKSDYLIIGKTFAAGLAGIIQIIVLATTAFVAIQLTGDNLIGLLSGVSLDINLTTIVATIFFGIAGYLSYLFIYAALGAMVSKVEDINYAVTPITLLFVGAYVITFIGLQVPHSPVFKFASYFPLTSVLAMPVRSSLINIELIEIIISAVIMLISIVVFSVLAIRIYRLGSLNYGNRMKLGRTLKMIFKGQSN